MLEKDLDILDKILKELNYTSSYRETILSKLVKNLQEYGLDHFTRNFLYVALAYDEGKEKASEIADYWEEVKDKGSYKTKLQKTLEKSPIFSKYI